MSFSATAGVVHRLPDLIADEFRGRVIGLLIEKQVPECAENVNPPCAQRSSYWRTRSSGCRLQRGGFTDGQIHAEKHLFGLLAKARVVRLDLLADILRNRRVVRRYRIVGGALEDVEMRCILGDERDRLHRGGSGADEPNAQTLEVDALVRPPTRVMNLAGKGIKPLDVRRDRRRQHTSRHNAEACRDEAAIVGFDQPSARRRRRSPR